MKYKMHNAKYIICFIYLRGKHEKRDIQQRGTRTDPGTLA